VGVEPPQAMTQPGLSGKETGDNPVPETIADGARTTSLGKLTFPLVLRYVNDMLTVTTTSFCAHVLALGADEARRGADRRFGRLRGLGAEDFLKSQKVGVILSGGNVDLRWAAGTLRSRSRVSR